MTDPTFSRFDGKLEPETKEGMSSLEQAAIVSVAISFKRIADHLAGTDQRTGLVDALYDFRSPYR